MADQSTRVLAASVLETYEQERGTGPDGVLTWDEYLDALEHRRTRLGCDDWFRVAAFLAAQLAGARSEHTIAAPISLEVIGREVDRYRENLERAARRAEARDA